LKDAKPLSLEEWSKLSQGTPETYRKIDKPNPYRKSSPLHIVNGDSSNGNSVRR
jgi:hypothetical protein